VEKWGGASPLSGTCVSWGNSGLTGRLGAPVRRPARTAAAPSTVRAHRNGPAGAPSRRPSARRRPPRVHGPRTGCAPRAHDPPSPACRPTTTADRHRVGRRPSPHHTHTIAAHHGRPHGPAPAATRPRPQQGTPHVRHGPPAKHPACPRTTTGRTGGTPHAHRPTTCTGVRTPRPTAAGAVTPGHAVPRRGRPGCGPAPRAS